MAVKIITDSGCDLPKHIIDEYDIDVLPLIVIIDSNEYEDNRTITSKELYEEMRNGKAPKTAQVPSALMKDTFEHYARENISCVYIGFSSELSGTFQAAVNVVNDVKDEFPGFDIDCIDTKCASLGQGLIAVKAAQDAMEGRSKEEIVETVYFESSHMEHIFTVDDLEYLFRGGRVSRASALMGGLLKIKPILNVEEGKLVPIEKVRGRNKVFTRIVDLVEERGADLRHQVIGISHGDDPESANKLKSLLKEKFGADRFLVSMIGSVIGAHAGPGTLAVFFLNEKRSHK